jgi:chemotaxis protein CheX
MGSSIELAKPFITAVTTVLSTMAGVTPTVGKPYVKKNLKACGDISAIVGITGAHRGTISLTFSRSCAIALVKGLLGDDISDIIQDTSDAMGEITNMVSGQARAGLAEMGIVLQGSTPSIILGDNHMLSHMSSGSVIAIPFNTQSGDFTLEFCME